MAQDLSVQMMQDRAAKSSAARQSTNLAPRGGRIIPPRMQPSGTPNPRGQAAMQTNVADKLAQAKPSAGKASPASSSKDTMIAPSGTPNPRGQAAMQTNVADKLAAMARAMAK